MENEAQNLSQFIFSWYDYTLFGASLGLSVLIGIYFGFIKKQSTANEYLFGGKEMKVFPISMSLIASSISGITLLSVPVDIYRFGVTYWLGSNTMIIAVIITNYLYTPVFYKLQLTSVYEYFELRFDTKTRKLSSFLFILSFLLYLPIVIYVPALALAQVTRFNMHIITTLVCVICIFYTTIGGLKAVVWTDALQFIIMIGATVAVFVMGVIKTGGFGVIWQRSSAGDRLSIDFDLDITKRDTIWTGTIGMCVMFLNFIAANQGFLQKCIALPTYKAVKQALIIFTLGILMILAMCSFTGLIMFAKYSDCDPITAGVIKHPDQLLPFYIMEVAGSIPGLPGLFIAGIFSAALSTLSAAMNCVAGVIYEDFVAGFIKKDVSQECVSTILKIIVVVIGVISTSLVFIVEHLGSILALTYSLPGITTGPALGMFTVGMLFPVINAKGALYGGITSLLIMSWIVFGSQWYKSLGLIQYPTLPLSVDGCENFTYSSSAPIYNATRDAEDEPLFIYKISYYYYYVIGMLLVVLVSFPVSLATRNKKLIVNRDCIVPFMHFLLPNESNNLNYYSVEKSLVVLKTS